MQGDIQRVVEKTGLSMPLASQILNLIVDSGASHVEVQAALHVVNALLTLLPIEYVPGDPDGPGGVLSRNYSPA